MTDLQASVERPFSVVVTAAAFSVKKWAVVARCSVVVIWGSTSAEGLASASARGWARAREERERRRGRGRGNFILGVGVLVG